MFIIYEHTTIMNNSQDHNGKILEKRQVPRRSGLITGVD